MVEAYPPATLRLARPTLGMGFLGIGHLHRESDGDGLIQLEYGFSTGMHNSSFAWSTNVISYILAQSPSPKTDCKS